MLQSIVIDEVALVEVRIQTVLLSVVLIELSYIPVQIVRVVEAVEALARPELAEVVHGLVFVAFQVGRFLANAIICRHLVPLHHDSIVDFILDVAEIAEAALLFQL